ncbi:hypothetical protein H7X46_07900 [Pseudonocardia sp. C8]|uniref:hypothetical protein n=1 Tax=Pseudonocardia sp. C8 TaxID=2762759 RepID=UPI001642CA59|nr:hypothetical protein [Pseudonocardia sp. C8]MBC3190983.1 hypothetical protein [Pseudonocardia sp. C8]
MGGVRFWLAAGAACVLVVLVPAGAASAQEVGEPDFGTHPGRYLVDSAIYAESVDGWRCHLVDDCRTEQRFGGDPAPIAWPARGQRVEVSCRFGAYYLVTTEHGIRGWSPAREIDSPWRQWPCTALDWMW